MKDDDKIRQIYVEGAKTKNVALDGVLFELAVQKRTSGSAFVSMLAYDIQNPTKRSEWHVEQIK